MQRTFIINEPIINGFRETGKYLYSLFVALKRVSQDYIRFTYHYSNSSDERSKAEISHVERVFAYEFYRQWCDHELIRQTDDVVINAEVPKQLIDEYYDESKHLYYPDMVLHSGQSDSCNNLIICEIKRKEYVDSCSKELIEDFKKLKFYLSKEAKVNEKLPHWEPFKTGVFVMIVRRLKKGEQMSVNLIGNHLNTEIQNFPDCIKKRIVCVVYDGHDLKYDTLYNMINDRQ